LLDDLPGQHDAVAGPDLVAKAHAVAEDVLAPQPVGDHRGEHRRLQLAHGEHAGLTGLAREDVVVVHRVEVAGGAREARDLRAGDGVGGPLHAASSITVSRWTTASAPSDRCRRVSSVISVIAPPFFASTARTTRRPHSRSPIATGAWYSHSLPPTTTRRRSRPSFCTIAPRSRQCPATVAKVSGTER